MAGQAGVLIVSRMDFDAFRNRLDGLDALLRAEGMVCGPDVWQRVFRLLESLQRQKRIPRHARDMVPLLGPLICKSPEDQARFPVLFEQWWAAGPDLGKVNRVISAEREVVAVVRGKARKTGRMWLLASLLLLAVLTALWMPTSPDPVEISPLPTPEQRPQDTVQRSESAPDIAIVDTVKPRPQPLPLVQRWEGLLNVIEQALFWLPILLALPWLARKYHQRWLLNRQPASGDDLFNQFRFERLLTPIFGGAEAERSLRDLRAAYFRPTRRLDVNATVEATARAADFFHPVYQQRRCAPEHLLLVRSLHRRDQQAALAEELLARFRQLGLEVQAYRFRDDPRRLVQWRESGGDYVQLKQLAARHGAARLLIISGTEIVVHPYSGEARSWLTHFKPWRDRVWLHAGDTVSEHAALLGRNDFLLLPLARDSLPELVSFLTAPDTKAAEPNLFEMPAMPEMLSAEADAWLDEQPPYGVDLAELLRQLERFVGTYGLRLLRAVAVYPKPHWQLTLALDYLLFGRLGSADPPRRREQRLTRLSRLPWLSHGFLPDWLREILLRGMEREERETIAAAWRHLFQRLTDKQSLDTLTLEVRTPSKRRIKLALADLRAMRKSETLDDPIFANILLGGKLGLLDFRLPQTMAKLLPGTGKWLDLRPALAAFLVTGLTLWGFDWGWQAYGREAAARGLGTWIAQQNAAWRVELAYRDDTQALAQALQQSLQSAGFQADLKDEKSKQAVETNTVRYPPGGQDEAQRLARRLSWLSYGAAVDLAKSSNLPDKTLQVQLVRGYQHGAGFSDELHYPYQALKTDTKAQPELPPIEPEMVLIKPGKYLMGSPEDEPGRYSDEGPQHEVVIGYAFVIGKYEVTFEEYDRFAEATGREKPNDMGWGRGKRPVIDVNWADAQAYTRWLSEQTGKDYRLPSEAEWEYAARAGTQTAYWWGDKIGINNAVCDGCGSQWDNKQTARVGSFKDNPFGLYDTAGNVWEWTADCWHENYQNAPKDGSAWLDVDGGDCSRRVVRGGSWIYYPQNLRSADRNRADTDGASSNLGFRVARAL